MEELVLREKALYKNLFLDPAEHRGRIPVLKYFFCTRKIGHSSTVLTRSHIAVPHKKKRSLVEAESREYGM